MNRRGFVIGVGTVAAAGVAAHALRDPDSGFVLSGKSRAHVGAGGFHANSKPVAISNTDPSAPDGGVTLGYIPGSAEFVMANSPPIERMSTSNFWKQVDIRAAIGILGYVPSDSPTIERIDITVNFALDEPPFVAPFYAWQFVNVPGQYVKSSSPLNFVTRIPNAAAIDVSFQVKSAISGVSTFGALSYPIGGSGLGPGIYALAGPSPATGGAPDWNQLTWGDKAASLARLDDAVIDFDYITLSLSPIYVG